jgi:alpha-tubulin suppressor-like RCC1 family protein
LHRPELIAAVLACGLLFAGCHCREAPAPEVTTPAPTSPPEPTVPHTAASLRWVTAEAGDGLSCGLRSDGSVSCWGDCYVEVPTEPMIQISVGIESACGLDREGELVCWCCSREEVCESPPPAGPFDRVEVGSFWACARSADTGVLTCFGGARREIVGELPQGLVTDFAVEDEKACAVQEDGTIACWGAFFLWEDDWVDLDRHYVEVDVGRQHGCALDTEGSVDCWGDDWEDQPFPEPPPGPFTTLAAFHQLAGALREDGSIAQWGWPEFVEHPDWAVPDEVFVHLSYGEFHACGVRADGRRILCWGDPRGDGSNLDPPRLHEEEEP